MNHTSPAVPIPQQERAGLRVLICSPVDGLLGGIPAAVRGLITGLESLPGVSALRIPYARFRIRTSLPRRLIRELLQVPIFIYNILRYRPHVVQIESSFDKKTLVRDSIFLWLSHRLGRPVVVRSHGGSFDEIATWAPFWRTWSRRFLASCNAVVVLARETYDDLCKELGTRPAFLVRPNPVDIPLALLNIGRSASVPTDEIVIVSAGRLIRNKGVDDLVNAMRYLKHPKAVLNVFGDGPLLPELRRIVRDHHLENRVHFAGTLPEDRLIEFYSTRGDIFAFPSYPKEGFPMAFFFAVGCGLSIVSTRVRPIPDYLTEPENCLWVEPRDPVGLARQLDRLIADRDLRRRQGVSNKHLVEQFAPTKVARDFISIYEAVLARHQFSI